MYLKKFVAFRLKISASLMGSVIAIAFSTVVSAEDFLVTSQDEYFQVSKSLEPGDKIILGNRVWNDFEISFHGKGTKEAPISLVAEEKGQVIISGQSNLQLHGEHLFVSGLVFRDGYTPTSSVISFRNGKDNYANHTRVSEVVIDDFTNPERFDGDYWVAMYGKNNRFDHNHLEGKRNQGVTMAVRLNTPQSRENNHRIDHNYFGPRQILGSNGGETLRIGTSHHSLTSSRTIVENNYFDRCDGELEIISNKSGDNVIRGNVFFESRGTLTLRHGNDTLVEDNVFFGNGVDHTGGIRLINKRQTIRNNYMEGLAGYRFGGALVVMNGVPNSPINRYHQVEESFINYNSLVNSSHIQLAAGSDSERSAVPITTEFKNNLVYNEDNKEVFTIYDDISGIDFSDNRLNAVKKPKIKKGFSNTALTVARADNGLIYPVNESAEVGVSRDLKPIGKNDTGVSWYAKPEKQEVFGVGSVLNVEPGYGKLGEAIKSAKAGDIINLLAGEHIEPKMLVITKPLVIRGNGYSSEVASDGSAKLYFEKNALFELQDGGSLVLQGLAISGSLAPDSSGNSVIRTQRRSMLGNYQVLIDKVQVSDLDINHSFNFLTPSKASFADRIEITDSSFKNVTGAVLALDKETDDYGIYNAEYVTINDSTFENIKGDLVDFYRGGTDESTFGPHFELSDSNVNSVGGGKRNKSKSSILLHGVQVSTVKNNSFVSSPGISVMHTVGEPVTKIFDNNFVGTPKIKVIELNSDKKNTAKLTGNSYKKGKK